MLAERSAGLNNATRDAAVARVTRCGL